MRGREGGREGEREREKITKLIPLASASCNVQKMGGKVSQHPFLLDAPWMGGHTRYIYM